MKKLLILFFVLFSQTGFCFTNQDYYSNPMVSSPPVNTPLNLLPAPNTTSFVNLNGIMCTSSTSMHVTSGCYKPAYYVGGLDLNQLVMVCTESSTGTTLNSQSNPTAVINSMRLTIGFTPPGTYTPMFPNLYETFNSNLATTVGYVRNQYQMTVIAEPVAPYTTQIETSSLTCKVPGTTGSSSGTVTFKRNFAATVSLTQPPSKNGFINQEIDFPFTVTVTDPGQSSVKIRTTFAVSSPCSGWSPELELASGATLDADGVTKGVLNSGTNNLHAKFTPTALGSFTCSGTMVVQLD